MNLAKFSCPFKDVGDDQVYCKKCGQLGKIAEVRKLCPDRPDIINPVVNTTRGGL